MEVLCAVPKLKCSHPNPRIPAKTLISPSLTVPLSQISLIKLKARLNSLQKTATPNERKTEVKEAAAIPTMSDILASSKAQNLDLQLQTLGPFFRITAKSLETDNELGRAEGLIRVWLKGRVLHLDSIRLKRETLGMERSIFGIGLFIGAVAVRYGYDCGCTTAELLAINDSDLYHTKNASLKLKIHGRERCEILLDNIDLVVRFYKRIGFKVVHEVTGSTMGDLAHMLIWGGIGTRMDANVEELLLKWCSSKSQALKTIEKNNIHQEVRGKTRKMKDRNHVDFGVPREVLGIPDLQHLGVCPKVLDQD
ncbi:hypothetical protein WN943_024246 [Citrus x changshan-huyou]